MSRSAKKHFSERCQSGKRFYFDSKYWNFEKKNKKSNNSSWKQRIFFFTTLLGNFGHFILPFFKGIREMLLPPVRVPPSMLSEQLSEIWDFDLKFYAGKILYRAYPYLYHYAYFFCRFSMPTIPYPYLSPYSVH